MKGKLNSNNLLVSHRQRICYHIHHHHLSEHRNTVNYSLIYHVHPYGAGARGSIRPRRETFSRTTAVLDSHFLVADIKMDGFNMRRVDEAATIAFETPGVMQDSEVRWTAVGGYPGGGEARARPRPRLTTSNKNMTYRIFLGF